MLQSHSKEFDTWDNILGLLTIFVGFKGSFASKLSSKYQTTFMTTFAYGQKGHELDLIIRDNQISH